MTVAPTKSAALTGFAHLLAVAFTAAGIAATPAIHAQSSLPRAVSPLAGTAPALPEPLPVDEAFATTAALERGKYVLRIDVLPGHYVYRDRFEFSAGGRALANVSLPKGKMKQDPNFGRVEIYEQPVQIALPTSPAGGAQELKLLFQGCSEVAGVCYPPTERSFRPLADGKPVAPVEAAASSFKQQFRKQVSQ